MSARRPMRYVMLLAGMVLPGWTVLGTTACGSTSTSSGSSAVMTASAKPVSAGTMHDGLYYTEEGAPDPLACATDAECVADTVAMVDGCCPVPGPQAQTRLWHAWIIKRPHSAACADVKCPDVPRPAPPPTCALDVHCVDGMCADACP